LLAGATEQDGLRVVRRQFAEHDAEYVKLLAAKLSGEPAAAALLVSTQQEPASVYVARGAKLKFSCGELMKKALAERGLRGGGSPSLAQGQIAGAGVGSLLDELEAGMRGTAIF
jgi:alanyl-tRNA synthetase